MTKIDPETVAEMLDGVTPGPWEAEGPEHSVIIWGHADRDDREYRVCFMTSDGPSVANARFIAWAREAVPALAAERDEQVEWVRELADQLIAAEAKLAAKDAEVKAMIAAAVLDGQLRAFERRRLDTPDELRSLGTYIQETEK